MPRQLNIRSDDAYRAAQTLAKRLDATTTDVVVRALRELEQATLRTPEKNDMTPEQKAAFDALDAQTAELSEALGPDVASETDALHDERGLPK